MESGRSTARRRSAPIALRPVVVSLFALALMAGPGSAMALDPGAASRGTQAAVPPPALPGIWRIDWAKSDARPRVDGSWVSAGGPGGLPGAEGAEGGARRGRRHAMGPELGEWSSEPLAAQTIIIFQRGAHLEISEDGRAAQPVDLGGMAVNASARQFSSIQEGRWEEPNLILTRNIPGGGIMTQTFTLATDGSVLELSARIQHRLDEAPLLIHRVYNKYRG